MLCLSLLKIYSINFTKKNLKNSISIKVIKYLPKKGTVRAKIKFENTKAVLIRTDIEWHLSLVERKSSSMLSATGINVMAYFVKGFTTY